jgi:hypothetical protein
MKSGVSINRGAEGASFAKQVSYATAVSLTKVAKEAQTAVGLALNNSQGGAFQIRNNWTQQSNKFGIKAVAATKDNLVSGVATDADWLLLHEESGDKRPKGQFIAIPTANVRRTKREIVQKGQRPKALRGKRDVLIKTKSGREVLYQRKGRGKNSRLVAMYVLIPLAHIKHQSTLLTPTQKIVEKRLGAIFEEQLRAAFETAT